MRLSPCWNSLKFRVITCAMTEKPNPVDVARKANALAAELGLGAHRYARKQADAAATSGDADQAAFWTAVADQLSPHCSI